MGESGDRCSQRIKENQNVTPTGQQQEDLRHVSECQQTAVRKSQGVMGNQQAMMEDQQSMEGNKQGLPQRMMAGGCHGNPRWQRAVMYHRRRMMQSPLYRELQMYGEYHLTEVNIMFTI